MSVPRTSKLYQFINYRMRVTLHDTRVLVGKFMAFDKHMNIVLGDCEEFRKIVPKGKKGEEREEKRTLGLLILRGESIVAMTVEGPPPAEESRVKSLQKETTQGPGVAKVAGRGVVMPSSTSQPVPGLSAPIPNLGGPSPAMMMPMGRAAPGMPPAGMPPFGRGIPPPMPPFPPGRMPPMPPGMPFPPPFVPGRGLPFPPPPPGGQQQQ